jgi:hypothetical protein
MGYISGGKQTTAADGDYGGYLSLWTTSSGANGEANSGGYERMRIDSSGKVGIGETSPDKQLHIKNTATGDTGIVIENTNNAQNLDIDFYNNGGAAQGRIRYAEGAGSFGFAPNVSATDALHILYDGKVGIGTTGPTSTLTVNGAIESLKDNFSSSNEGGQITLRAPSGSTTSKKYSFDNFNVSNVSVLRLIQEDDSDGANGVVRMALDTKGTHYFTNSTSSYAHNTYAHAAVFSRNSTPHGTVVIEDSDVSSGIGNTVLKCYLRDQDPATLANFINFSDGGGTVGSITHNDDGGGVSFNTTSDYRLKENVDYDWEALTLVNQLRPAKFNFISNSAQTVQGFLAHEVSDIVPSSVRGDKDHMMEIGTITDSDGDIVSEDVYEHFCKEGQTWTQTGTEPLYQQLDYARLVPLLTKAIQEQQTIIESLTARIETLEG